MLRRGKDGPAGKRAFMNLFFWAIVLGTDESISSHKNPLREDLIIICI